MLHQIFFCHKCCRTVTQCLQNPQYNTNRTLTTWYPHVDNCISCDKLKKLRVGGRKRKHKGNKGRPKSKGIWTEKIISPHR